MLSLIVSAGLFMPTFALAHAIGLMIGMEDYAVLPDLNRGQADAVLLALSGRFVH